MTIAFKSSPVILRTMVVSDEICCFTYKLQTEHLRSRVENNNLNTKESTSNKIRNQDKVDLFLGGTYGMESSSPKVTQSIRLSKKFWNAADFGSWPSLRCSTAARQELLLCAVLKTEEKCKQTENAGWAFGILLSMLEKEGLKKAFLQRR